MDGKRSRRLRKHCDPDCVIKPRNSTGVDGAGAFLLRPRMWRRQLSVCISVVMVTKVNTRLRLESNYDLVENTTFSVKTQ